MTKSVAARALAQLTAALAARDPVPAGGAAGIAALASGIAVAVKVARISGAPGRLTADLEQHLAAVLPQFDADCDAYRAVLRTRRERAPEAERRAAWREASRVPLEVADRADRVRQVLDALRAHCRPALRSDLDAAVELCAVGARISRANAAVNAGG